MENPKIDNQKPKTAVEGRTRTCSFEQGISPKIREKYSLFRLTSHITI